jgi:Methyltransferase domain
MAGQALAWKNVAGVGVGLSCRNTGGIEETVQHGRETRSTRSDAHGRGQAAWGCGRRLIRGAGRPARGATVDLGTGDGRAVLAAAAARPDRLAVGVDASAAAMAEASWRAARRSERGGLPNAVFVVAAAEALPPELDGVADLVTIQFPWGSLLKGLLDADPRVMAGWRTCWARAGRCGCWCRQPTATGVPAITEPTLRGLAGA